MLEAFRLQAISLFPPPPPPITFQDLPDDWKAYYTPLTPLQNAWSNLLTPPTLDEVKKAISSSSLDKAPGPTSLTARLFAQGGHKSLKLLTKLFQLCLSNDTLPDEWLDSSICFIPKGTHPFTGHLSSMRPIALLEVALKLLMRILFGRIVTTLMHHNAI